MPQLRDLYRRTVLDHSKRPRNHRRMENPTHQAEGDNPVCGDRVTVFLQFEGETIVDASFVGSGCAICTASASMMTDFLKGRTLERIERSFGSFRDLVSGRIKAPDAPADLGDLAVFAGVREFPVRAKCALLPWRTANAAVGGEPEVVSTE